MKAISLRSTAETKTLSTQQLYQNDETNNK